MTTLSLLSRGRGQVISPNQRLEVHFEPEDYFNWKNREGLIHVSHEAVLEQGSWRHSLHKTYTTKRGALVLYAEDLALPSLKLAAGKKGRNRRRPRKRKYRIELRTLRDLAGAILSYGRKEKDLYHAGWQPYLHFLREEGNRTDRQMHPGYSAKRYLSCLSQTWDPSTVYRLQYAGTILDSSVLQNYRRQQDLSIAPAEYHLPPAMSSAHHDHAVTAPWKKSIPGHYSPVLEEQESEEELREGSEEPGWRSRVPAPSIAARRTLGLERTSRHERASTRHEQDSHTDFPEKTSMEFNESEEHSTGENQEHMEIKSQTRTPSFGNIRFQTSPRQTRKCHTTFYGGQFHGRKKSEYVKQEQASHQDDREDQATQEPLRDGGFLPRISSTQYTEHGGARESKKKQIQEPLKLPPISEELPRAQPQRKRRIGASEPPKELLVLPLLVQFQCEEIEKATDEGEAAHESSKSEFTVSEDGRPFPNDPIPVALPEGKVHNLQMDINWNPDIYPDAIPVVPPLGSLPPLNRKKGPGNQTSHVKASSHKSTTSSSINSSSSLPTGTIRGTLPEELRDYCKGSSVGSLIMGPDGEIICLSFLGSAQDTDVPVQLDFVSDGAHLSMVSEASQEEDWPGIQQTSKRDFIDPDQASTSSSRKGRIRYTSSGREESGSHEAKTNIRYIPVDRAHIFKDEKIDSEDTVSTSSDQLVGTLDKKHADRLQEGTVREKKLLIPTEGTFDTTQGTAEGPEEGKAQGSELDTAGMDTGETGPIPQASPVLDALARPGSSTQPPLIKPQTERAPDALKQHDGEFAGDMPQQKVGEPESVDVLRAKHISILTEKETLPAGPSDGLTEPSTERRVQQAGAGSLAPVSLPSAGGVPTSLDGKEPVTDQEQEAVLEAGRQQPIPDITKQKRPSKRKVTPKQKSGMVAKHTAAPKETKKKSEKKLKDKAAFVVGKPKQEKSGGKRRTSTKQESTKEMSMDSKTEVVQEEEKEGDHSGSVTVRHAEPDITVSSTSRGTTPDRSEFEEPQLSETPSAGEHQLAPESQVPVKRRETSAHPSITISLSSGDAASISSEFLQGSPRQSKSSRDRLRAELAEKRRREVERKRREKEELKREEQEKLEREQGMKEELEREQQKRAEAIRMIKQQHEEERQRQEQEELRKAQLEKEAQQRTKQQQEEYRRKMMEMQRQRLIDEKERAEMEEKMRLERERELAAERLRVLGMAEHERQEFYRRKQEEEERARQEEEERQQKLAEQQRAVLMEAKKQVQLFARETASLEQQLGFHQELLKEAIGMDQSQDISRPWVFSYFQLLEMLSLQPTVEEK
ncbi:uncharacterized protein KIAA2012 homolog [Lissotriton helveticus]